MVASLLLRGTLNEDLAADNFAEMFFVYARLEPFLAEVRQRTGMQMFAAHMQKFVESSAVGRERVGTVPAAFRGHASRGLPKAEA